MKSIIRNIIMNILYIMPKKFAHIIFYKHRMHKKLDLNNPTDFNEKIQWLIVNRYGKKEAKYTDKYLVKNLLKNFDEDLKIPNLYFCYNNINEIKKNDLPNEFVMKANNGCGSVFVCRDKNSFDFKKAKSELSIAIKENFAKKNLEYHYSYIEPKIICEELLNDNKNHLPIDYKFYCFDGMVKCVLVCTDRVDENNKSISYYDVNWNKLDYELDQYKNNKINKKPLNFNKMIDIASKLSKGFEFVRVDLYNINGNIYFGELTFTPACGMINNINQSALDELGKCLKLN